MTPDMQSVWLGVQIAGGLCGSMLVLTAGLRYTWGLFHRVVSA